MTEQQNTPEQEQELQAWVREQFQKANKYLAEKGILTQTVAPEDSRYLAPYLAVWKLRTTDSGGVWVISGDLPTDHIDMGIAKDGRDALRHFSMKWQLQAENILQTNPDDTQKQFAELLINRAENLYQIYRDDTYWTNFAS